VKQGLSLFKMPENRVEFVRLAFARTLEWHGFHQVTDMLTKEEMPLLLCCVGRHNLFDETASVGYYGLDLQNDEDRWVAAHIVRLAVLEPGDNMIGERPFTFFCCFSHFSPPFDTRHLVLRS
jgi:hypothetical protein